MIRCTMSTVSLLLLLLCFAPSDAKQLRVRGLMQMESRNRNADNPRTGLYQNPCTGSWSNDVEVLSIDDCEVYGNDEGGGGGVGGSSSNTNSDDGDGSGGNGDGSDVNGDGSGGNGDGTDVTDGVGGSSGNTNGGDGDGSDGNGDGSGGNGDSTDVTDGSGGSGDGSGGNSDGSGGSGGNDNNGGNGGSGSGGDDGNGGDGDGSSSSNGGNSGNDGDRDTGDPNLDCNINTKDDRTSAETIYPVEFWYGVKSTSNDTSWLPILEDKIYDVAIGRMENCIGYLPRRQLRLRERRLGVLGITSAPDDEIREDVRLPGAYANPDQECYVVEGGFQVIARENDDMEKTLQSMQDAIEDSMTNDELLGEDIPNVTQVIFLGTSQQDVENQYILPPIISPGVLRSVNTDDGYDNRVVPIILAASATGLVALLLLLLWRKRAVATRDAGAFAALDDDGSFTPLVGTGDPPGNFHHGVYHYTRGGQGYLSTNCYDCHETRLLSNSDYGGILPPVLPCMSEEDDYNNLILANSKDIGGKTSGMDVHGCASSTCKLCRPFTKNVEIIPIERLDSMGSKIVYNEELAPIKEEVMEL